MIICNGDNVATMSKTNRQTKQRSGQGVVMEQRCEKTTVSLHCDLYSHNSCITELTMRGGKIDTGHTFSVRVPGNSVLVSCPNELARSRIKRAES